MALDERARHELHRRLEEVLGADQASTLMEMLPPVGWTDVATKRDLDALDTSPSLRLESVEHRLRAEIATSAHIGTTIGAAARAPANRRSITALSPEKERRLRGAHRCRSRAAFETGERCLMRDD